MKTMLMRLCFPLIIFAAVSPLFAQADWIRHYGGTQIDIFNAVCESADSHLVCAGSAQSFGTVGRDFWLVKLADNGDTLWSRIYGGDREDECFAVQRVSDGGFILAGRSTTVGGSWNGYAVRVDSIGDTLWTRNFGGTRRDEFAAVCETTDGGFLFAGMYSAGQFWAVKVNANGDSLWSRTYGGSGTDVCYAAALTADDGFYLAGSTESYGNGHSVTPDYWLLRINSAGDSIRSRTYGGTESDVCTGMTLFSTGGGALCGYTQSFGAGLADFWVVRFAANGDSVTSRTFGGTRQDFGHAVWATADGGLLIAGNMDLGTGSAQYWMTRTDANLAQRWSRHYGGESTEDCRAVMESSRDRIVLVGGTYSVGAGSEDGYVVSINPPVAILAVEPDTLNFGSVLVGRSSEAELLLRNSGTDSLVVISVLSPSGFSTVATLPWILSPNSEVSIPVTFTPALALDYSDTLWVVSSAPASPAMVIVTGTGLANAVDDLNGSLPVKFSLYPPYPNPFNPTTTLSFDLPQTDFITLSIFDVSGRLVAVPARGRYSAGHYRIEYNGTALASGTYFARFQGSTYGTSRKLVLMK
jgi:hypothetical protein